MHWRPGPVIRSVHHATRSPLVLQELLIAYRHSRPNQPMRRCLSITQDQFFSATIRQWSPSRAAVVPREDRRCNESALPLNFLNLDDHSCLTQAVACRLTQMVIRPKRNGKRGDLVRFM